MPFEYVEWLLGVTSRYSKTFLERPLCCRVLTVRNYYKATES